MLGSAELGLLTKLCCNPVAGAVGEAVSPTSFHARHTCVFFQPTHFNKEKQSPSAEKFMSVLVDSHSFLWSRVTRGGEVPGAAH